MEKNNKVKIKFKGVKVFSYFLCLTLMIVFMQDVLAQGKQKEVKVKLSVLNGDEKAIILPTDHKIKLYANGAEVYAKCVKTVCTKMAGRCVGHVNVEGSRPWNWWGCRGKGCGGDGYYEQHGEQIYVSYKKPGEDGKGKKQGFCDGAGGTGAGNLWNSLYLNANNKCSVRVEMSWECNGFGWKKKENVNYGTFKATYEEYCATTQCSEWEIQADSVLSLMPEVGLSKIDPNLIEY